MSPARRLLAGLAAGVVLAVPAGCGSAASTASSVPAPGSADRPQVLASFYPLQFVVERVGGEHVDVASLTPPGADPHELELSPRQVRDVRSADVVVYLSGLQPATDEAVATRDDAGVLDTVAAAEVQGSADGPADLHFWLDPVRLAAVADDVAAALAGVDPDHAGDYAAAADALAADLGALDAELADGLAACRGATVVTSHAAFGFLAARYGLDQVGITGVDPEVEPSPARLRAVRAVVEERGVRTLFFEVLASPDVTRVLAADLGVGTAVLDPIEGQTDPRRDYLDTMRANLEALRAGLACGT